MSFERTVSPRHNQPAAQNAGIESPLIIGHRWLGVGEPERSATNRSNNMSDYEIIETNAENLSSCSFCGYKNANNVGHRRKKEWLKERYAEGLRYKVLRSRKFGDIGMIEYAPGNHAWRPVEAEGYLVIHCLMVNSKHKGKGLGTLLLNSCLRDAKRIKCRGVAVVTGSDSFMAGSDLFLKAGFVLVESSPPYELLVKKLKKAAPDPRFIVNKQRLLKKHKRGLTILAADQCPMVPKCVKDITEMSRTLGLEPKVIRVTNAKASRELPTPYGMFSIIYDGEVIADRPVSGTRFWYIMRKIAESGACPASQSDGSDNWAGARARARPCGPAAGGTIPFAASQATKVSATFAADRSKAARRPRRFARAFPAAAAGQGR